MIEQLSFSSITSYLSCPRAWKFKYIEKAPAKTGSAAAFASAFHETLEHWITRDPEVTMTINEMWSKAWSAQAERVILNDGETLEALQNEGIRILSNAKILSELNAILPPQAVDLPVSLTVPAVPIPITGCLDMLASSGLPCSFETSPGQWPLRKAKNSLPPLFYLAALRQMQTPSPLIFRHYVFVKTKEPQLQIIDTACTPAQLLFLFSLIQNVWKSIQAGACHENPHNWLCSEPLCDFSHLCRGRFA